MPSESAGIWHCLSGSDYIGGSFLGLEVPWAWVNYAIGMIGFEMRTHADKAAHYRVRAAEMRALANEMKNETRREMLLKAVDDYERLARIQDQLATDDPRSL